MERHLKYLLQKYPQKQRILNILGLEEHRKHGQQIKQGRLKGDNTHTVTTQYTC